jgi:hypothetical protein
MGIEREKVIFRFNEAGCGSLDTESCPKLTDAKPQGKIRCNDENY